MQITYSGARRIVYTATKAVEKKLGALSDCAQFTGLFDGRSFSLRVGDFPASLRCGEWSVELTDECASVCGTSEAAILDALEHFFGLLPAFAEGTLSLPYRFECRKTYPVRSVTIDGEPIDAYTVFYIPESQTATAPISPLEHYPEDIYRCATAAEQAAEDLCHCLGQCCGAVLRPVPYREGMQLTRCIVVGAREARPYGEWRLFAKDGVIYAEGGDICGMESAVSALAALLTKKEVVALDASSLSESGRLPKREDYLANADAFVPCYAARFSLPADTLTIREKEAKLADPENGLFILAHRGEHTYYPENSLEADSSEVDLSKTKDGTFVLLHDETLTRTTDVQEKKGKNGLPDSDLISDWTLEQLRQLRLRDTYGSVTPFPVPTVEELFRACDGRIYLHLDKKFDYEADIFPMMRKCRTYRCTYLCNHLDLEKMRGLRDAFRDQGVRLPGILRIPIQSIPKSEASLNTAVEAAGEGAMSPAVVLANDYCRNLPQILALAGKYRKKLRIASWMMWGTDTLLYWREARRSGFGLLMTNFPMLLREDENSKTYNNHQEVDER